jgi:hypothetical protein
MNEHITASESDEEKKSFYTCPYKTIGFCLPIEFDIPHTIKMATSYGLSNMQIFTSSENPLTRKEEVYEINDAEVELIQEYLKVLPFETFIHADTKWNLCGNMSKKYLAWSKPANLVQESANRYMEVIASTIRKETIIADKINKEGKGGVIVHFGSWKINDKKMKNRLMYGMVNDNPTKNENKKTSSDDNSDDNCSDKKTTDVDQKSPSSFSSQPTSSSLDIEDYLTSEVLDALSAMATTIRKCSSGSSYVLESKLPAKQNIILENSCLEGNKVGGTIEDMYLVRKMLRKTDPKYNLRFCYDTCHAHQSSEFDFSKTSDTDKFYSYFDKILGIQNLACFHLNDSQQEFAYGLDRHAPLLEGKMWKDNEKSFWYFINQAEKYRIPMVIETRELSDVCKFWKE